MIRLASLELLRTITLTGGHQVRGLVYGEPDHVLDLDTATNSVVIDGKNVPIDGNVLWWLKAPLLCPDCKQGFDSATALGAHRSHKHQVKGTTR